MLPFFFHGSIDCMVSESTHSLGVHCMTILGVHDRALKALKLTDMIVVSWDLNLLWTLRIIVMNPEGFLRNILSCMNVNQLHLLDQSRALQE